MQPAFSKNWLYYVFGQVHRVFGEFSHIKSQCQHDEFWVSSQVNAGMAFAHLVVLVGLAGARVHVGGEDRARLALVVLGEERMRHGGLNANAAGRLKLHHLRQQVDGLRAITEAAAQLDQILIAIDAPLREGDFHLRQVGRALPQTLVAWRAEAPEDLEDLTNFTLAVEERLPVS